MLIFRVNFENYTLLLPITYVDAFGDRDWATLSKNYKLSDKREKLRNSCSAQRAVEVLDIAVVLPCNQAS